MFLEPSREYKIYNRKIYLGTNLKESKNTFAGREVKTTQLCMCSPVEVHPLPGKWIQFSAGISFMDISNER